MYLPIKDGMESEDELQVPKVLSRRRAKIKIVRNIPVLSIWWRCLLCRQGAICQSQTFRRNRTLFIQSDICYLRGRFFGVETVLPSTFSLERSADHPKKKPPLIGSDIQDSKTQKRFSFVPEEEEEARFFFAYAPHNICIRVVAHACMQHSRTIQTFKNGSEQRGQKRKHFFSSSSSSAGNPKKYPYGLH